MSIPSISANAVSANEIHLRWTEASNDSFLIYRDHVQIATSTELAFSDTSLSESTQYMYQMAGVEGGVTSGLSNQFYVTTNSALADVSWSDESDSTTTWTDLTDNCRD